MPPAKAADKPIQVVKINQHSDGDASHRPTGSAYYQDVDAVVYREKLAQLWMKQRGEDDPKYKYILDRLPAGYTVWCKQRLNEATHIDKWLFGHPSGKTFDSPNRSAPHFLHLMENGGLPGCSCVCCAGKPKSKSSRPPSSSSFGPKTTLTQASSAQAFSAQASNAQTSNAHLKRPAQNGDAIQQTVDALPTQQVVRKLGAPVKVKDEEGIPDVYHNLITKLRRHQQLDEEIQETQSMDWRIERDMVRNYYKRVGQQPAWIPRLGEVVLFARDLLLDEEISLDTAKSGHYLVYSKSKKEFKDKPRWEAGVVTEVPEERLVPKDLVHPQLKQQDVNYSGCRVEPLPDTNLNDVDERSDRVDRTAKAISKRHKYVPLAHMRPFSFYTEFLYGVDEHKWHETINSALQIMATTVLVDKHRFQGNWPSAKIHCRGLFIGCELVLVGDMVRLFPPKGVPIETSPVEVLEITAMYSMLKDLDKSIANNESSYSSSIRVEGRCWTTAAPSNSFTSVNGQQGRHHDPPPRLDGYAGFRLKHPSATSIVVPFQRIASRLYEAEAIKLWFPIPSAIPIDADPRVGMDGIRNARQYSEGTLRRITTQMGAKNSWLLADHRVKALDIHTVNGQEVAAHDEARRKELATNQWQKDLKIIDGKATLADLKPTIPGRGSARLRPGNEMVQSALEVEAEIQGTSPELLRQDTQMHDAIDLDSDEDDEESDPLGADLTVESKLYAALMSKGAKK